MNNIVISGIVVGDIIQELSNDRQCVKFKLRNLFFSPSLKNNQTTYIDCICYGSLARYCYNELYENASILITGRLMSKHYIVDNRGFWKMYVQCNTVTKLEQEEYE